MTGRFLLALLRVLTVLLAASGIWSWLSYVSPRKIEMATGKRDHSENRVVKETTTKIGEKFTRFRPDSDAPDFSGTWPGFRGARRENIVEDGIPLSQDWGADGPPVLWRVELGEGYAGAIIVDKRVFVLDYLEKEESDALRCFSTATGAELWRRSYKNPLRRNHGKSRTVPTCAENVVVTIGPAAHVMAVDAVSGDLLWTRDLVRDDGAEVPQWYTGQCPLIDRGRVILGVGGKDTLIAALDLKTGKTIWTLPNDAGMKMSHASVAVAELAGVRQFIYAGIGGITACDEAGKFLWRSTDWKPAVWAPTPVQIADDRLFLTAGYGAGSAILRVKKTGETFVATVERQWKPTKGPACEQQTPLVIGETLWTIQPKDAGARRAELVAADVASLPEIKAESGKEARFGLGPYLYADGAFWILDDEGILSVYAFQEGQLTRRAKFKVLPGVDSWGPIALAGGRMILRDSTSMVCLDLRKERP